MSAVRVLSETNVPFLDNGFLLSSLVEPVSTHSHGFFRNTSNLDSRLRAPEGVVGEDHRASCQVRPVLPVPPSVHVEAMTERRALLDIVSGRIATSRKSGPGDGVPVVVEEVPLD